MDNILTYLAHQKLADVTGLFTLLFGIPAAVIGLIGFFEARRWKRSEFLAAEMKAFFERPTTKVVCKMLDWEEGTVYADDFPDLNSGRIKFNEAEVIKALAIESTEGESPSRLV